jgi:hypothetical protein
LRVTPPSDGMPVRDAAYFGMDAVVDLPRVRFGRWS